MTARCRPVDVWIGHGHLETNGNNISCHSIGNYDFCFVKIHGTISSPQIDVGGICSKLGVIGPKVGKTSASSALWLSRPWKSQKKSWNSHCVGLRWLYAKWQEITMQKIRTKLSKTDVQTNHKIFEYPGPTASRMTTDCRQRRHFSSNSVVRKYLFTNETTIRNADI